MKECVDQELMESVDLFFYPLNFVMQKFVRYLISRVCLPVLRVERMNEWGPHTFPPTMAAGAHGKMNS